jgi:hypothetical protein
MARMRHAAQPPYFGPSCILHEGCKLFLDRPCHCNLCGEQWAESGDATAELILDVDPDDLFKARLGLEAKALGTLG